MIYFLSNIYKWSLTLLTVESSSVVFSIYFMRSAVCYALIQDGGKSHESAYYSIFGTYRLVLPRSTGVFLHPVARESGEKNKHMV